MLLSLPVIGVDQTCIDWVGAEAHHETVRRSLQKTPRVVAMTRVAGWLSAVAFLAAPVILYFGRPRIGCKNLIPRINAPPCTGPAITPAWTLPAFLLALTIAVALACVYVWILLDYLGWPLQRRKSASLK